MFFGLTNVPRSFQGYINKILAEKLDIFIIVYLDDIIIYTKDLGKGQVKTIWWVLEVLRKYGLYTNLKKYCFYQDEIKFLDFIVFIEEIMIKEKRIDIVKKWPKPKSVWGI